MRPRTSSSPVASTKAPGLWCSACRSLIRPRRSGLSRRFRSRQERGVMKRFNLSDWAVSHPALILFLIFALGVAGFFSYRGLGRAEDPFFTVKGVKVSAMGRGPTAAEMQTQVADPIEKKL